VQTRTADQTPSAQALFEATQGRDHRFADDARALVAASPSQLKRGFASLETSQFAGGEALATLGEAPDHDGVVYVAVSFSMPPADLRRLARDAQKAGAVLVIRGLVRGSFKETLLAARQVFDEGSLGGVSIDPNVFRAFDVQAVPTVIAAAAPVQPCAKGLECIPLAPAHDRIGGNISLGEALRRLKTDGEAGAEAAAAASARLED
jgi:conjugal transfer pilus assembly protein TrbC